MMKAKMVSKGNSFLYVTFIVSTLIQTVSGLNFVLIPMPMNSHVIMFGRMGAALISEGHSASLVLPSNVKVPSFLKERGVDVYIYQGVDDINSINGPYFTEIMMDAKGAGSFLDFMNLMTKGFTKVLKDLNSECQFLMDNKELRQKLEKKKFDFAIVDSVQLPCVMNYPVSLNLEYFMFSIPVYPWAFRIPDLPSFIPQIETSETTNEMNFFERVINTINHFMVIWNLDTRNAIDMTKYPPGRAIPDMTELKEKASFWFILDEPALLYPRPHMPNTISVGDLMVSEAAPLSKEYQNFMDGSPEGVILVSYGSFVEYIPERIIIELCDAFSKVPQRIIWKIQTRPVCADKISNKIKTVPWVPQNDILAHPNLKLFITHCGLNSLLESLYHAKPMLGMPISLDQPHNAIAMVHHGYGVSMDLVHFTSADLVNNVTYVLNNAQIMNNVNMGSKLLKDKPLSPSKRIDYWVRHIAEYGSKHLRSGAFKLNIYQFLNIDVYFFVFVVILVFLIVTLLILTCTWKVARRCFCAGETKTKLD